MNWRSLSAADLPAAAELCRLAGWNQTQDDWKGYLAFEPGGSFAVDVDGRLAGTAMAFRYGEDLGWIGMVLVHPDFRKRGIAKAILGRAIDYLRACKVRSIGLDATPAGRAVYMPLGFRDDLGVSRLERPANWPAPEQVLAPAFPSVSFDLIESLDLQAFGVARPRFLEALSRRAPHLSFASLGGDGYLIAREGREAVQLGPWVASDPGCAEKLLLALIQAAPRKKIFVDLPRPNQAGAELLARYGFVLQRGFTRMYLDGAAPPGRPEWVFGTSGAEKG